MKFKELKKEDFDKLLASECVVQEHLANQAFLVHLGMTPEWKMLPDPNGRGMIKVFDEDKLSETFEVIAFDDLGFECCRQETRDIDKAKKCLSLFDMEEWEAEE